MIHVARKATTVTSLIGLYAGHALIARTLIKDRKTRLQYFNRTVSTYAKRVLNTIHCDISTPGFDPELLNRENFLIVGNHMSYLDILIMSSVLPSCFVTSVDMGETKFLGSLCELGGALFVERRHRGMIEQDTRNLAQTLSDGFNLVLYPEGRATNGEKVFPFKKSLLMSAVQAQKNILPVCLKYLEIDGEPFSFENRDRVCWHSDTPFAAHAANMMKTKSLKVELKFLDVIKVTPESTRHELADKAQAVISDAYGHPLGIKPEEKSS
jgi:lyso-ornithine lipid O-acyltransferase